MVAAHSQVYAEGSPAVRRTVPKQQNTDIHIRKHSPVKTEAYTKDPYRGFSIYIYDLKHCRAMQRSSYKIFHI